MKSLIDKIRHKLVKLRLQPIRVFCFHQVSDTFDENLYCNPDWMSFEDFVFKIKRLQKEGYCFVSLKEAYKHISDDHIRTKKYTVLTCDDGLKCQAALLSWLEEQKIPMTMFVSVKNLDGETCGEQMLEYFGIEDKSKEKELAQKLYLSKNELRNLNSPYLEIGIHGYEHNDVTLMTIDDFEKKTNLCFSVLRNHPNYVPFYAYAYGRHNANTDNILHKQKVTPVYMDGLMNYNDKNMVHRILL